MDNGQQPAGVEAISSSPVSGDILLDAGRDYSPGSAIAEETTYRNGAAERSSSAPAPTSGAAGSRCNMDGVGEPDAIIQQATANLLGDMGVRPTTPAGMTLDATGALQITTRTPAAGASGVAATADVRVTSTARSTRPR